MSCVSLTGTAANGSNYQVRAHTRKLGPTSRAAVLICGLECSKACLKFQQSGRGSERAVKALFKWNGPQAELSQNCKAGTEFGGSVKWNEDLCDGMPNARATGAILDPRYSTLVGLP